jgi:hypothetical protein
MSHTTTLRTIKINNTTALKESVEYLQSQGIQCELLEDTKPRMYYQNQHGKCDFVLRLKDSEYDIGFDKQTDGSYAPVFDSWAGHIAKQVGIPTSCKVPQSAEEKQVAAVSRLLDCYAVHAAKQELMEDNGYYTYEISYDEQDGSYTLEASESY